MKSLRTHPLLCAQLALTLLFAGACVTSRLHPNATLRRVEAFFTDIKFRLRGTQFPKNHIVIVDIDDASVNRLGRWPWRRDYTGFLIDQIFAAGARLVALDMSFPEPTEFIPEELDAELRQRKLGPLLDRFHPDLKLAETFRKHSDKLVGAWWSEFLCQPRYSTAESCPVLKDSFRENLPAKLERFSLRTDNFPMDRTIVYSAPQVATNIPLLEDNLVAQGFANATRDPDGLSRRTPLVIAVNGKLYPSLPLATASRALKLPVKARLDGDGALAELKIGKDLAVAAASNGVGNINFRGPAHSYTYVSAMEMLAYEPGRPRELAEASVADQLADAVVLVGVSAIGASDIAASPLDSHMPGVEIQATLIDNLMSGDLLSNPSGAFILFVLSLLSIPLAVALLAHRLRPTAAAAAFAAVFAVLALVDVYALFARHIDLPTGYLYLSVAGNFLITLFYRYASEEKQRKFLKTAFGKYVSPVVVDQILKDRQLNLGGQKQTLTLLFCDVRDFTTFSETRDAKEVGDFLNEYLDLLTEIVFLHGGTVDKYIGDAIMAFWGAPLPQPDHARRAMLAAQEIQRAVMSYHDYFLEKHRIDLRIGIGLHTGPVAVGNMGSHRTFSYTAIGDTVNLAARLESATKEHKVSCLLSASTLTAAYPIPDALRTRKIGGIHVKGKEQEIEVHELVPPDPGAAKPQVTLPFQSHG